MQITTEKWCLQYLSGDWRKFLVMAIVSCSKQPQPVWSVVLISSTEAYRDSSIPSYWLDVPERVVYKLSVMVFNCLHGQAPQYLVELCQPVAGVASWQHLRSATLVVLRHQISSYGWRAFWVAGPSVWNSMPDSLWNPIILTRTVSDNLWRRFCSQRTDAFSTLEVSRRCAI